MVACLLALCAVPAIADIRIPGDQHIGDEESSTYSPRDPVLRERMLAFPTRFHLTQPSTITAVTFENAVSLNNHIQAMVIDGTSYAGTLSGSTYTLASPVTLSAGTHTIAPDPGCLDDSNLATDCVEDANENDISFSALVLSSPQTTTSVHFARRRNIGDDNDQDDNYEANPRDVNAWYPDASDGLSVTQSFNLSAQRVLSEIRVYRLREVDVANNTVSINGVVVGTFPVNNGNLTDPHVIYPKLSLAAGTHSITVTSGDFGDGNRDTHSFDDIILVFGSPSGGQLGSFNAVDSGGNALTGRITTKRAGASSTVDIVAINTLATALNTLFNGTVTVELMNAADDSAVFNANGCRSSWTPVQTLGTVIFNPLDLNPGRKSFSFTYNNVLRKARLRMSSGGSVACSTDAFAIRPNSFGIQVSHANSTTAGTTELLNDTGVVGSKVHRAGQPFTVRVTARNASGATTSDYDGTVELSLASVIQGPIPGVLGAQTWTSSSGVLRSDNVTYSEAGTFTIKARDAEYAIIDADDTDGNATSTGRVVESTAGVGRFTPDHFRLLSRNTPTLAAGCGAFTYLGQAFTVDTIPQAELIAVNASGARTLNYTDNSQLYKLPSNAGVPSWAGQHYPDPLAAGIPVSISATSGLHPFTNRLGGQITVRFGIASDLTAPRTLPEAPYDLEIQLTAGSMVDSDGVTYADPYVFPLTFGDDTPGNGISFGTGTNTFAFGRLFVRNAYGSELSPLAVTYGTEFYDANGGYGVQTADNCTTAPVVTLSGALAAATSVTGITGVTAGLGALTLAAPNPTATGSVDLSASGPAWLGDDTNGDTVYAEAAEGQASFGVFRQSERQIYLRETYQ